MSGAPPVVVVGQDERAAAICHRGAVEVQIRAFGALGAADHDLVRAFGAIAATIERDEQVIVVAAADDEGRLNGAWAGMAGGDGGIAVECFDELAGIGVNPCIFDAAPVRTPYGVGAAVFVLKDGHVDGVKIVAVGKRFNDQSQVGPFVIRRSGVKRVVDGHTGHRALTAERGNAVVNVIFIVELDDIGRPDPFGSGDGFFGPVGDGFIEDAVDAFPVDQIVGAIDRQARTGGKGIEASVIVLDDGRVGYAVQYAFDCRGGGTKNNCQQ